MATVSNARLKCKETNPAAFAVSLETLPFPSAVIDPNGVIVAANAIWLSMFSQAYPGASAFQWLETTHAPLLAGVQSVLRGERTRYEEDFGPAETPQRLTAASCAGEALLVIQSLKIADPVESSARWQAYKMETIGRLLGGVAHDFANLLTLIAGHSELLLNRIGEKDPLRPELDEIHKAAGRGSRLTSQLLGFTRGQTAQPRPLDLNRLITEIERMLRPLIGEHIELVTSLKMGLGCVIADAGQMEQVLMNLILNARDAMPHGGRIRVETFHCELGEAAARAHDVVPGPYILLSISDTGHGISQESMERIFQPFFTTKERGKGTGLGLSTVRTIVKQSGGNVWVSSLPGHSACFTLCLPRAPYTVDRLESTPVRAAVGGSETVLLVEDEDSVRLLLSHILSKRGYQVVEASDGVEALRILEERGHEIHLVLTDMVMPNLGGQALAGEIRRILPQMRVIFMSGYTDDVLVRTGALGPEMTFLQKPLRPDVLAAKVREALDSPSRPFNPR